MGVREKLNGGYALGSVFLAAILAAITESGVVFLVALVILLVVNLASGEIRFKK